MTTPNTKSSLLRRITTLLAAWLKDIPPGNASYVIGGVSMTGPQVVQKLQGYQQLFTDEDAAKAKSKAAQHLREQSEPEMRDFANALITFVKSELGPRSALLPDFGVNNKPRRKASPETNVVAAQKRANSRAEHGILGKKQREARVPKARVQILGPDGKPIGGGSGSGGSGK